MYNDFCRHVEAMSEGKVEIVQRILERFELQGLTLTRQPGFNYLFASYRESGYFLVYDDDLGFGELTIPVYVQIAEEARQNGFEPPYHVIGRYEVFQSKSVYFYKMSQL